MADDYAGGETRVPIMDLAFDSGTLDALRAGVKAQACQAGLPQERAQDMVLAGHELAANAVRHGAGAGRLRIWKLAEALHCEVDDGEPLGSGSGPDPPWPSRPGHGLWLVRQVADRMRIRSGARGTRATIAFNLPRRRPGSGCLLA